MNDEQKKAWEEGIKELTDIPRVLSAFERSALAADAYMKRLEKVVEAAKEGVREHYYIGPDGHVPCECDLCTALREVGK